MEQKAGRSQVILDNPATHKTKVGLDYLEAHPNVHLHFTPTCSSWLNQVEIWSAKIERDAIERGVFTSVADPRRKIMRYIRRYDHNARPIRWTYRDPTQRFRPAFDSSATSY